MSRVAIVLMTLVGCRTDYTRCGACFADDPTGYCRDKVMEPLGEKNPNDAKCNASLGLCDGVESRAMQGVPDAKHEAFCKDRPKPFDCKPEWTAKFRFDCETKKVGPGVPF